MRDGFIFHYENIEDIEDMTLEEKGAILDAMIAYSKDGTEADFDDRVMKAAWKPIRRRIDKDAEAYEERCRRNSENGKKGGRPSKDEDESEKANGFSENPEKANGFSENPEKPRKSERFFEKPKKANTDTDTDTNTDTEKRVSTPAPAHESAKKYGEYGWVKLTDSQHSKLCDDLGAEEVQRCIRYVDESAQSTGNKNKWRDWNLVIRKCSRDKWGFSATGARDRPKNKFCNFKQRDDDLDALAHKLATQGMEV